MTASLTVAALYVARGGCYYGLPDVDPWDEVRDARLYAGPWPVVAHPPCARWGAFWFGAPGGKTRFKAGDDSGCFAAAIAAVRQWGGVLEHPAHSKAWAAFGLACPLPGGLWSAADMWGGWTCKVEQGHYGHALRKPTWLYLHGAQALPDLCWGKSAFSADLLVRHERTRDSGNLRASPYRLLSHRQRAATPLPFRDLLLSIARQCRGQACPSSPPPEEGK